LGTLAFDWGLGERGEIGETIVVMFTKVMALDTWYSSLLEGLSLEGLSLEKKSTWYTLLPLFP